MKSVPAKAFLSCSFKAEDAEINSIVSAVCDGLDIHCSNVDGGSTETPPDKALELIREAEIVIAVAVARSKFDATDQFSMPEAVSNEISFAYTLNKPLLIIKENNVRADGFHSSYGTHLPFKRDEIRSPDFLAKLVKSIHGLKLGAISDHELLLSQEVTEYIAEGVSHLYELEKEGDGYCWQHSMQRTIRFIKPFNKPLKVSRWNDFALGKSGEGLPKIELNFEITNSSRPFKFEIEYEEHTAYGINADIHLTPTPAPGDWIEYYLEYRGEHLCATYMEDSDGCPAVEVGTQKFAAFDGIIPVNRAKDLEIQFRFPRDYRLAEGDATFFVASFSKEIDYTVDSEIARANVRKELVGGKLSITAKVSSPLLRHVYGVAWHPPAKPVVPPEKI